MSSKEYPEFCSTNKTFVYRNQKFRSYGIGIIKLTGPTGKEPNPCDHVSEDEKIRRVEIYEFKTMSIFFEFWKSYNRRNKRNMNHLCDPNLHGIQKFEIGWIHRIYHRCDDVREPSENCKPFLRPKPESCEVECRKFELHRIHRNQNEGG